MKFSTKQDPTDGRWYATIDDGIEVPWEGPFGGFATQELADHFALLATQPLVERSLCSGTQ